MGEKEKLIALMKDVVFPAFPGGGLDVKVKNQLPEHGFEAIAEALIAAGVVVLDREYTDKDGEEALRRAMRICNQTNNAVTRYTADAIAEKLVREAEMRKKVK